MTDEKDKPRSCSNVELGEKHVALLRTIVEEQEVQFPSCGKLLLALESAGFIFIHKSSIEAFGNKDVQVRSAIDGECYLDELDSTHNV